MKTSHLAILLFFFLQALSSPAIHPPNKNQDYQAYHLQVIEAERLMASEKYQAALSIYETLFENYDFVFLREYQIATQLALQVNDSQKAEQYLKQGMLAGWDMKSIKKNKFLSTIRNDSGWKDIKKEYKTLRAQYESGLNQTLRKQVKKMFSRDQWKALGAFLKFSSKAQDKYAEKKFAPHSERQIAEFNNILANYGYPGEQLIGNDIWMSTILSHHNSISKAYTEKDTLYPDLQAQLKEALLKGQISPFELAMIDDWYRVVKDDESLATYGIIDPPSQAELEKANQLRSAIYYRSVELRNQLVDIEEKTGMNLYIQSGPWINGKIEVKK